MNFELWTLNIELWTLWYVPFYLWTLRFEHWTPLPLNFEVWTLNFMIWTTNCTNDTNPFILWTTNFSNYANAYCNVIRVIRRLVDSVFNKNMSLKHMSLCHSVFVLKYIIEIYVSMHSVFSSHSVCQMFSQSANQLGTNCVRINGFLVCKRCPLRRLLTPFWSLIKHLLKSVFATTW